MAKRRIYKNYRTSKSGGQHYWTGRKGIAKDISKMHSTVTEREASHFIDMTFEGITKNLKKEGRYSQPSFGVFKLQHKKARPARPGRNPFTNEAITIKAKPAMKIVKFRPSKELKKQFI